MVGKYKQTGNAANAAYFVVEQHSLFDG